MKNLIHSLKNLEFPATLKADQAPAHQKTAVTAITERPIQTNQVRKISIIGRRNLPLLSTYKNTPPPCTLPHSLSLPQMSPFLWNIVYHLSIFFNWVLPAYYRSLASYYISRYTLPLIAWILGTSFIIQHPDRDLPITIFSIRSNIAHSFEVSSEALHRRNLPSLPPTRTWTSSIEIRRRLIGDRLTKTVVLDATLSGPPLRQGMAIAQLGHLIYIGEELGRWPSRDDLIATISVDLIHGNLFPLFIPVAYFKRLNILDSNTSSPPLSLVPFSKNLRVLPVLPLPSRSSSFEA